MAEIDAYLKFLAQQRGSDIHFSSSAKPQVRLLGNMTPLNVPALTAQDVARILSEIMPERNKKEFEQRNDTDFAYELKDIGRFRTNIFRDRFGMGGVLRLIPTKILTPAELGLPEAILKFCQMPKGLVLVTGPTGCGKSTTLATMIDVVNQTRRDHIITIEDPIEFVHENKKCLINQREVFEHTTGFKAALRAALREDPDVVLVGEMRDLETTHIAIETAETGHLVFATLHTTTAASTVDRLIDQFPHEQQEQIRTMLSVSLKGIISQMLLRRKDNSGRVAALEVLAVTPAVANLIREGKTHQLPSVIQTGGRLGMIMMNDSLLKLVIEDAVDPKEAMSKAIEKDDFAQKLKVAGISPT